MNKENVGISEAIDRLIELTRNKKINWRIALHTPSHLQLNPNINVIASYSGSYAGKCVLISEIKRKKVDDFNEVYWEDDVILELVDILDNPQWQFPDNVKNWDLLEAVKWQAAGVEDFLIDLFK